MSVQKSFNSEIEGDTLIVMPRGSVGSLAGQYFKPEVDGLLSQIKKHDLKYVLVDLAEVSYFGTMMLGTMHQLFKHVRDGGGGMVLCNVSVVGREILRVSGFDSLWPICRSRQEALQALRDKPQSLPDTADS
ncbi:MAG: STAS domain-containing protein [Pirellulales bacterium]|nr:STAS domain-containing protein [Pirellulales bacterium]